jgi:hypothetical protein
MSEPPIYPNLRSAVFSEGLLLASITWVGLLNSGWSTFWGILTGLYMCLAFALTGVIITELMHDLSSARANAYMYLQTWTITAAFGSWTVQDFLQSPLNLIGLGIDLVCLILFLSFLFGPRGRGRGRKARAYWGAKSQALLDKLAANPT